MANTVQKQADASLKINDVKVSYKVASLEYEQGYGEKKVDIDTVGGGEQTAVVSEDVSTKKGTVTFKLSNTEESRNLIDSWAAGYTHTIQIFDSFSKPTVYTGMSMTNQPKYPVSTEAEIDVTFEGPASVSN